MGNPRPVSLVMHHGHAGDPGTFAGLVSALSLISDGFEGHEITLSCPISPSYNGIRSWWHPDAFGPSAADLDSVQLPDGPVVLGGFSQGAAYAAALAVHRPNVVGLIVVAGFLTDPAPTLDRPLPSLCLHSDDDETVDPFLGSRLARWAKAGGGPVAVADYSGGHQWTPEVDRGIIDWLGNLVDGSAAGLDAQND